MDSGRVLREVRNIHANGMIMKTAQKIRRAYTIRRPTGKRGALPLCLELDFSHCVRLLYS